jgi:hypothetical protein
MRYILEKRGCRESLWLATSLFVFNPSLSKSDEMDMTAGIKT